jgi:hypothetical protein
MKHKLIAIVVILFGLIVTESIVTNKQHHAQPPTPAKVVVDKNTPQYKACADSLNQTFSKIKSDVVEVAKLGPACKAVKGECKELGLKSKTLIESVTGSDMNLRWQDFSCSPIMFVKLKQIAKSADGLLFLSILRHKTTDLDKQALEIQEPLRFMESDKIKITEACCPRPS